MDKETTQSLVIASMLVAFLVAPSLADTITPSTTALSSTSTIEQSGLTATGLHPIQNGNVRYVTGGIGDEERAALEAVKNDYNLQITNTNSIGEFSGETKVSIADRQGNQLINAQAGPLFYAGLPPGDYTVEANHNGKMQNQKVSLNQSKSSSLYFRW